jgi:hypothetical protein
MTALRSNGESFSKTVRIQSMSVITTPFEAIHA